MSDFPVANNPERSRFEAVVDGETAVLDYQLDGDVIAFTHTGVPPAIDNRGIGTALVRTALDYAEEHGLRVRPICVFVESFIEEHQEYQHLVDG
jgi:predicted GNAT family acetyltransferase